MMVQSFRVSLHLILLEWKCVYGKEIALLIEEYLPLSEVESLSFEVQWVNLAQLTREEVFTTLCETEGLGILLDLEHQEMTRFQVFDRRRGSFRIRFPDKKNQSESEIKLNTKHFPLEKFLENCILFAQAEHQVMTQSKWILQLVKNLFIRLLL